MASDPGALPIKVWVAGIPKGQPRGRAFVTGGKPRISTPGTAEAWKSDIALAFRPKMPAEPFTCALELVVDLHFKRPKTRDREKDPSCPIPCDKMPDWDNAGKAVSDALEHIGVIANDKTIAFATVRKWYAAKGGRTGALIQLFYVGADAWPALHPGIRVPSGELPESCATQLATGTLPFAEPPESARSPGRASKYRKTIDDKPTLRQRLAARRHRQDPPGAPPEGSEPLTPRRGAPTGSSGQSASSPTDPTSKAPVGVSERAGGDPEAS